MTRAVQPHRLQALQSRLGHQFADEALLIAALTHRSASGSNNERLEFLGDSWVNHVVANDLYQRFPQASEGDLTRMRSRLVRGTYLAGIAKSLGLGDALILGVGERKSGGRHRDSILADALEAVAAAVLLDGGPAVASEAVLRWFGASLQQVSAETDKDNKTPLQEWLQARTLPLPQYDLVTVLGPDHEQVFEVDCTCAGTDQASRGQGGSRREAEQAAAAAALEALLD